MTGHVGALHDNNGPEARFAVQREAELPTAAWDHLPREVITFIQLVAARPLAGIEVVECSPPYDDAEIASSIPIRVICDTLGCLVGAEHLPRPPDTVERMELPNPPSLWSSL